MYDPDTAVLDMTLPKPDSDLRWERFIDIVAKAYEARFEGKTRRFELSNGERPRRKARQSTPSLAHSMHRQLRRDTANFYSGEVDPYSA